MAKTTIKKQALVTGGAGFIASHLRERLLKEGYRVVCKDNLIDWFAEQLYCTERTTPYPRGH